MSNGFSLIVLCYFGLFLAKSNGQAFNDYDVICFNDEELKKLLSKLSTNETILYHSQDDDDIYVGKNITN